ncbi:CRE-STR-190 protein [Caenorhabditis remanei]|uniref:CRE-STR-190 protein n=1 Tax=Caenorhabditis remanei TaxID=31234 RepID=E3MHD2_CAERE|nr:CRE-STR-190 protein [Caenorhabditis remanei]
MINRTVGQPIENISYIGTKFYNFGENGTMSFYIPAWIGVCQMWFMVVGQIGGTSIICVFGFGTLCYLRLSTTLSIVSSAANNLQKQLFYSLVLQTLIPLILMHFPITIFFLCPMLNLDTDFATAFILITITLYPAVDPLPSFLIIKTYREAVFDVFRAVLCLKNGNSQQGAVGHSMISMNSAAVVKYQKSVQRS